MAKRKRRARRSDGHVYQRGQIWWFKWIGDDHLRHHRSSASTDRSVAEDMLRAELDRRAKGLSPSPDPRLCLVDDLLEALEARYTTEGRRSIDRLRFSTDQLLRLFRGVQAMRVSGADILRYAQLRLKDKAAPRNHQPGACSAARRLPPGPRQ